MSSAATIYEQDKAREIARFTGEGDPMRYFEFAIAPIILLFLLVLLLRRSA